MTAYIILTNSNASLSKQFVVLQTGFQPILEKAVNIKKTVDGELDIAMGDVFETHKYTIRCSETVADADWGTLDDLKTFFGYNNPNGTPSNIITLTDHKDDDFDCIMKGEFSESPLTTLIEGASAHFLVTVTLVFIPS